MSTVGEVSTNISIADTPLPLPRPFRSRVVFVSASLSPGCDPTYCPLLWYDWICGGSDLPPRANRWLGEKNDVPSPPGFEPVTSRLWERASLLFNKRNSGRIFLMTSSSFVFLQPSFVHLRPFSGCQNELIASDWWTARVHRKWLCSITFYETPGCVRTQVRKNSNLECFL